MDGPPYRESYPLADADRLLLDTVELTAVGLIPPRAPGQSGIDFHRGALQHSMEEVGL